MSGPAKNALGSEMMRWIRAELRAAEGQPVLLTGTDDSFSAGLNLKELASLDAAGMEAFLSELEGLVADLFHYPAPTAAAINGHAIAGGCVIALCCDVRICTTHPKARLGLNEVALGLRFPPRTFEMVHYRLDARWAEEVLLGAGLHSPEASLRLGLVDALADDPIAASTARLAALTSHPAQAYAAAKHTLRGAYGQANEEAARTFLEDVLPVWTSDALKVRIAALLGRR